MSINQRNYDKPMPGGVNWPNVTPAATHTPTPWKVHPTVNQHRYNAALDFGPSGIAVGVVWGPFEKRAMDAETEANAAFIVRACNAHDELVAALKDAEKRLLSFAESGNDRLTVLAHDLRATLTRAGA